MAGTLRQRALGGGARGRDACSPALLAGDRRESGARDSGAAAAEADRRLRRPGVRRRTRPGRRSCCSWSSSRGTVRGAAQSGKTLSARSSTSATWSSYGGEEGLLSIAFDPDYAPEPALLRLLRRPTTATSGSTSSSASASSAHARRARARAASVIEIAHPGQLATTTAASSSSGPTATSTSATGDGGGVRRPRRERAGPRAACSASCCGSTRRRSGGYAVARRRTRSSARAGARRDLRARAAQPVALLLRPRDRRRSRSATSARTRGRRSTIATLDGARGANFGWDLFEGNHGFEGARRPSPPSYADAGPRVPTQRRQLRGHRRLRRPRPDAAGALRPLPLRRLLRRRDPLARPRRAEPGRDRRADRPRGRPARARSARARGGKIYVASLAAAPSSGSSQR